MVEEKQETEVEAYIQVTGNLFESVQDGPVFNDSKTFVDCVPIQPPEDIMDAFLERQPDTPEDLEEFVYNHFHVPEELAPTENQPTGKPMERHIQDLWSVLSRPAHDDVSPNTTLIPLIRPYIVPGGRFREIYYWDSYFTVEGLAACGRMDTVEDMVRNLAYLVERFGFIPNGNRIYYLGRSQPPVFALMVDVLQRYGREDAAVEHRHHLKQEYRFWMDGRDAVSQGVMAHRRLVRPDTDTHLNRYWDDRATPRPEAYEEDTHLAQDVPEEHRNALYRNIRAACESGWDFSSRWFQNPMDMRTIRTTELLPVDLNAYLYFMEKTLADLYAAAGDEETAAQYQSAAEQRKAVFDQYFWDPEEQYYFDHDWVNEAQTDTWSLAATVPLFVGLSSQEQADAVASHIKERFLHDGGLVATLNETGEQWDYPNGWAPCHWMAVNGLIRYGHDQLAQEIAERWIGLNQDVYNRTGKMMEKYNVVNTELEAGGGEYTLQDGFGWTNGVAIAFLKNALITETDTPLIKEAE